MPYFHHNGDNLVFAGKGPAGCINFRYKGHLPTIALANLGFINQKKQLEFRTGGRRSGRTASPRF